METRRTLLYVDDDPAILGLAARSLEALGHEALTATSGPAALELVRAHHAELDAVLVDYTMPRMDGEEVARRIKAIDPSIPLILVSGHDREQVTAQVDYSLFVGFLHKPFVLETLGDLVEDALFVAR